MPSLLELVMCGNRYVDYRLMIAVMMLMIVEH